jgi:CubicO group peptidase (beta-lactamase class C family)
MKSRAFKRFIKVILVIIGLLLLCSLGLVITGNGHILSGITKTYLIGKNKPDIDDQEYFHTREIKAGEPIPWEVSSHFNTSTIESGVLHNIQAYETTAFLVIWKDSLFYEEYWLDGGEDVYSNSFSMAKTYTSMAIGAAVQEGLVRLDQPVGDFIPKYSNGENTDLQVRHLLQMSSGIDFGESYTNPFGYQAKAYYGNDLESITLDFDVSTQPGTLWKYEGGNSVLLGLLLEEATGKSLSEYFSEKIWSEIGCEQPAYWNLDDEQGLEKAFSAVYSTARDFAHSGQLMLDSGKYHGNTLIPTEYFEEMVQPVNIMAEDSTMTTHYGLHYWLGEYDGHPFYSLRGMRGQYVITMPWMDAVVVRLGHEKDDVRENNRTVDMDLYIKTAIDLIEQKQ